MLNAKGALQPVGPCAVIARTCEYRAYGWPVNHGKETSTETAGTRKIGMVVDTEGSVADGAAPAAPVAPVAPVAPEAPVVGPGVAGAVLELAATTEHPVPGFTPVRTFDQTTELSLNARLDASSNS